MSAQPHVDHDLSDEELVGAFEACTLPPSQFSHRRHLALGRHYLRQFGFPAGAQRFCERLQAYVTSVGASAKYHETITWAYLVLMNEELTLRSQPDEHFDAMIARRPDLLDHRNGALAQVYDERELESPEARRVFVLPRRR